MVRGELRQEIGGGLADALAEAVRGRLELAFLHFARDRPCLGHGGFAVFPREDGLQGGGRPFPVTGRRLGEHVAHEVHHAPLAFRVRQHRVDRGDESGAPVADHQSDAPQPAFDHASEELLPAGRVLAHALVDRDDLAPALRADADGDEDAHVLHVPAPGSLVPHAVHEHVRVLGFQRAFPPLVDLLVDLLEFVAQCLGWHPLAPQQLADVVHPACAHAREVHLHQRLLDAGFAPPVTFDHRRLEQGALQFGRLETQLAGLGGQRALVVAGAERLPVGLALVSGGVSDLVGLGVEHGVDGLLDLDSNQSIELGLEHGVVELYDFIGHGFRPSFQSRFSCVSD